MVTDQERNLVGVLGTTDFRAGLKALADLGPSSVDVLLYLMETEGSVYKPVLGGPRADQAVVILAGRIGESVLPVLDKYAQSSSADIRRTVAASIRDLPPSLVAAEVGRELANDTESRVRATAIISLAGQRPFAETELVSHLNDLSPEVREASTEALGKLGVTTVVPRLMQLLQDSDPRVQAAAARALGILQADSAVDSLMSLLQDSKRYGLVKMAAAGALAKLKVTRAIPVLNNLANSSNEYEFQQAMYHAIEDLTI